MKWIKKDDVISFINNNNYDIRISKNARWIDQKCTPDVISAIADFIINYIEDENNQSTNEFTSNDIWHYPYSVDNIENIFKKPNPNAKASNEYDKFFQQPMELFANANLLNKTKKGNKNIYSILDKDILQYIATSELNALFFLQTYIEKVLKDSNLYTFFEDFFRNSTQQTYTHLKEKFSNFTINNTKINGVTECNRIFTKVLNPLAFKNNCQGSQHGRLSKHKITKDMLMYNRDNFRDIYSEKPKDMPRKEYEEKNNIHPNKDYYKYQSSKAKKLLQKFNTIYRNGLTEVTNDPTHLKHKATVIHHIFPEAQFPTICFYLENLIALTPTQHTNYAHPNGNTQIIDETYQQLCLLSKAKNIEDNINDTTIETIYKFSNFLIVLSTGFNDEKFETIEENDFNGVIEQINLHY